MTLPGIHDRLLLLCFGFALDALFGDMAAVFRVIPHPVALAGRAIAAFDRKLNRPRRGDIARRFRGIVTLIVLVPAAGGIGWVVERLCRTSFSGAVVEMLLIAVLLAWRSLHDHVLAVAVALGRYGVAGGRQAVSHIVGRNPASLDESGVARAAIESLAENFSDGVVAPVFWYLALGLPGLFAYKMANTLDSMIGHKDERYRAFGWAAARFDDLANLIPARLSGVVLAIAALFARGAAAGRAVRIMLRDARRHRSPNAGWPESAMAGALGLSLAGPRQYAEGWVSDAWLGDGTAQATPEDILRALGLYRLAGLFVAGLSFGGWLAAHLTPLG
ncbi:MAG TPA: adenosylcobinamide-phosphate synthase CbiB [Stellaceae bacterium]|jgi:adenosylcobinamide-phosphate synthase|nr:adenosylcobinamide-phosphate synthase CbiB [Stellaceae bacterium]